jgi:hypothetical protein
MNITTAKARILFFGIPLLPIQTKLSVCLVWSIMSTTIMGSSGLPFPISQFCIHVFSVLVCLPDPMMSHPALCADNAYRPGILTSIMFCCVYQSKMGKCLTLYFHDFIFWCQQRCGTEFLLQQK